MKTTSGVLLLTKTERKALEVLKEHTEKDMSYLGGGSFSLPDTDSEGNYFADTKAIKQAKLGLEVIDFVLHITE